MLSAAWHPQRADMGVRQLTFGRTLYIERDDFAKVPPPKYKRLVAGGMVRLRNGFIIRCDEVIEDANGAVVELRCSYVPESKSGSDTSGLKPKGVIHWVSAHCGSGGVPFVRASVQRSESGEARLRERAEPGVADSAKRASSNARSSNPSTALPVRAARLLLQRRFASSRPSVFNRTVALREDAARRGRQRAAGCSGGLTTVRTLMTIGLRTVMEVSPRDGLQNESVLLSTEDKLTLIHRALAAGFRRIEVTSFVHPKRVPQMADAEAVCKGLPQRGDVTYAGLILNRRGYDRALATRAFAGSRHGGAGHRYVRFAQSGTDRR